MILVRARIEAAVLCSLAIILGIVLFGQRTAVSSTERLAREGNVFVAFRPTQITTIALESRDDSPSRLVLSRDARDDPHAYVIGAAAERDEDHVEADRAAIVDLLNRLEFAEWLRTIPPDQAAGMNLGLEDPRFVATIEMGPLSYRLTAGAEAPTPPGAVYARLAGTGVAERVGVISSRLVESLSDDERRFRGRLLLPYGRRSVERLAATTESQNTAIVRDDIGFLLAESSARVSREASDRLFFQLARLELESYLSDDQAKSITKQADHYLRLTQNPTGEDAVRRRVEVLVGGKCPGRPELVAAQRTAPDLLSGCVSQAVVQGIRASLRNMADQTLLPLAADEIDHVVLQRSNSTLDLLRDEQGFLLVEPERRHLPLETGNEFLQLLADTRGRLVEEVEAKEGVEELETVGQLTATGHPLDSEETVKLVVELLPQTKDGRPRLRRVDDGRVVVMPASVAWAFDPDSPWYRSKQLLDLPPDDIQSLSTLARGQRELVAFGQDGTARLEIPDGRRVDEGRALQVRRTLASLEALRWLTAEVAEPRVPHLVVSIALGARTKNEQGTHELRVGPRVRAGHAAWASWVERPFVLATAQVDELESSLIDLSPAVIEPEHISRLQVSFGHAKYEFERQGDRLVALGEAVPALGPAVEEALSALVPLASTRGGQRPKQRQALSPTSQGEAELVLEGKEVLPGGAARSFRLSFGDLLIEQGVMVQLVEVEGAGLYYFERRRVLDLLGLL